LYAPWVGLRMEDEIIQVASVVQLGVCDCARNGRPTCGSGGMSHVAEGSLSGPVTPYSNRQSWLCRDNVDG
jgi:hypothetical protein